MTDYEGYEAQGYRVGTFDVNVATILDANCAIVYREILDNERHLADGRSWAVYSVREWREIMPYFTEKQIWSALDRLEKAGLVFSSNHNKSAWDKTKWYSTNPVPETEK